MSLAPNDKISAAFESLNAKLYREQPETMDTLSETLNLLAILFCEHEFETKEVGGDPTSADSTERVRVCKKCGMEGEHFNSFFAHGANEQVGS